MSSPSRPLFRYQLEKKLRERREKLTFRLNPIRTVIVFSEGSAKSIYEFVVSCYNHPVFLFIILPATLLWYVLERIDGPHSPFIRTLDFCIEYLVWWVGLGILSSIGLGTGLQSGVLFLFPHIMRVSLAARTCKTTDFESITDMWFRSPTTLFKCPLITESSTPVSFYGGLYINLYAK